MRRNCDSCAAQVANLVHRLAVRHGAEWIAIAASAQQWNLWRRHGFHAMTSPSAQSSMSNSPVPSQVLKAIQVCDCPGRRCYCEPSWGADNELTQIRLVVWLPRRPSRARRLQMRSLLSGFGSACLPNRSGPRYFGPAQCRGMQECAGCMVLQARAV